MKFSDKMSIETIYIKKKKLIKCFSDNMYFETLLNS